MKKHKILKITIANILFIGVIVAVYFINYTRMEEAKAEVYGTVIKEEAVELEEAKPAMTEDELEAVMSSYKQEVEVVLEAGVETVLEEDIIFSETSSSVEVVNTSGIDFVGLQEMNPDVYAWISIPGTDVEYPVLQHETDNAYYLNYNIDGSYGYPGCIYTENLNSKDFTDSNTVIYGHNMKNGTMFAGLHKFENKEFFDTNKSVVIYTPEKTYNYQIFAAYIYDNRHLLYSFDFKDQAVYENYLTSIFDIRDMSANIDTDVAVTGENKIITLVTCIGDMPENRLLVQAVLLEE